MENMVNWVFLIISNFLLVFILKFNDDEEKNKIVNLISIEQFKIYALFSLFFYIEYNFIDDYNYNSYGFIIRTTLFSLYIFIICKPRFFNLFNNKIDIKILFLTLLITIIVAFLYLKFLDYLMHLANLKSIKLNEIYLSKYRLLFGFVFFSLLPALFEEIFYRGLIYDKLKFVYSNKNVVIISSFLFFLSHLIYGNIISIIYIFPLGLFLGILRTKFNNLVYPIACHFFYNFIVFIYPLI
jgi:membrane protease YdiL (CAAX protease family)